MDFYYKLFPFKSLFNIDDNTLTAWFALVIVVVFLGFLLWLLWVTRRLRRRLQAFVKTFSEDDIIKDKFFSDRWKEYKNSFINFSNERKTDDFSYEYFNEKNLLASNTRLRIITSIPATLVGLGILGTFVGLTYGISNFDTTSTEEIKGSIETLLGGMGTAFISSIYGMSFSIIFTFVERYQTDSLHNSVHNFCYMLDRKFLISKDDERKLVMNRQESFMKDMFLFKDDSNNEIKPGNVFRDLYKESVKQSVALQTFSTDLANLIEAGFDKIINDPDKGVVHELTELKAEIINLGSKLQDPASEMTQNVVKELEHSMAKMVEEFKASMSGSQKAELENLTNLLGQAGSSLNDFPSKLEIMTDNLDTNFRGLQEVVQQISQKTLEQSEESTGQMRQQVEEMSEILKTRVGDLQSNQEVLMSKQTKNLEVSESLLSSFNVSIDKLNSLSNEVNDTVSTFMEVQDELKSASVQLRGMTENMLSSSHSFKEAQRKFAEQSDDFLENNAQTIIEIQRSLSQASDLSQSYSEKFSIIESGLQNIFKEIESGLDNYSSTVGESMDSFLGKYSDALNSAAKSLTGAANKQEDIMEELVEQLSRLQTNRIK